MKPTQEKTMEWEKELRSVYETAASLDDKSDIDCVIDYVQNLLTKEQQRSAKELFETKRIYNAEMIAQVKKSQDSFRRKVEEEVIGEDEESDGMFEVVQVDLRTNKRTVIENGTIRDNVRNELRAIQRAKLKTLKI